MNYFFFGRIGNRIVYTSPCSEKVKNKLLSAVNGIPSISLTCIGPDCGFEIDEDNLRLVAFVYRGVSLKWDDSTLVREWEKERQIPSSNIIKDFELFDCGNSNSKVQIITTSITISVSCGNTQFYSETLRRMRNVDSRENSKLYPICPHQCCCTDHSHRQPVAKIEGRNVNGRQGIHTCRLL